MTFKSKDLAALSLFQSLSTQFYLLEVLIEKAVHDGVGADGGHGEQVAGGVDGQHQPVAPRGVPAGDDDDDHHHHHDHHHCHHHHHHHHYHEVSISWWPPGESPLI